MSRFTDHSHLKDQLVRTVIDASDRTGMSADDSQSVEFSVEDGCEILVNTMRSLGYDAATANLGVWSAIWLEERHMSGISKLVVYLCMVHDIPFQALKPKRDKNFGMTCICPFMLADTLFRHADSWIPNGSVSCGAPAETSLAMASLAEWASSLGKSIRLTHLNYTCLYSSRGCNFETDDGSMFGWIDVESAYPMMVELCDDQLSQYAVRRVTSITLPRVRLRDDGILDLRDQQA